MFVVWILMSSFKLEKSPKSEGGYTNKVAYTCISTANTLRGMKMVLVDC